MKKAKVPPALGQFIIDRSGGSCEICGSTNGCQIHHIIRRIVESDADNLIMLCWEHHHGTNGVHGMNGHKLDLKLKIELQEKYFAQGNSESEVRKLMGGKLYFEEFGF